MLMLFITVHNSSCGKVMFSQACVKNSVHTGGVQGRGACVAGEGGMYGRGTHGRGYVWQGCALQGYAWQGFASCMAGEGSIHGGGMHGRGHAWQGACMAGGVHGREHVWQGCMAEGMHGRGCAWQGYAWKGGRHPWQEACMALETATAADGTHPTGMHSCISGLVLLSPIKYFVTRHRTFVKYKPLLLIRFK